MKNQHNAIQTFGFILLLLITLPYQLFAIKLIEIDKKNDVELIAKNDLDEIILQRVYRGDYRRYSRSKGIVTKIEDSKILIEDIESSEQYSYYIGSFIPANVNNKLVVCDSISYYTLFNVLYFIEMDKKSNTQIAQVKSSKSDKEPKQTKSPFKKEKISSSDKSFIIHKVKAGESLWRLSKKYGATIEEIQKANNMPFDQKTIYTGNTVRIPADTTKYPVPIEEISSSNKSFIVHKIKNNECLWGLSKKYEVAIEEIQKANNMPLDQKKIYFGNTLRIPADTTKYPVPIEEISSSNKSFIVHKIKNNECLWGLSKKYEVAIEEIQTANNMPLDQKTIYVGNTLRIPIKDSLKKN